MPFLNDLVETNKKTLEKVKQMKSVGFQSRFHFNPEEVIDLLSAHIVGQPEMVCSVQDALDAIKADIRDPDRPLSVMLFVGSTGVGKTETIRVLAKAITGKRESYCRIDMNTLAQEHYAASLTGAPPGYVGSKDNHTLLNPVTIQGSYSCPGIVLFDEVEKASKEVIQTLLNVLDSGHLELAGGTKSIDFRNSLIFLTSNLGARKIANYRRKFQKGWRLLFKLQPTLRAEQKILELELEHFFEPEFLNRIDQTVFFKQLGDDFKEQLLDLEMEKLKTRVSKKTDVTFSADREAKDYFSLFYDGKYGAREISRLIRTVVEPQLARSISKYPYAKSYTLSYKNESLAVIVEDE